MHRKANGEISETIPEEETEKTDWNPMQSTFLALEVLADKKIYTL
jgi:hypothetical protein